MGRAPGDAHPRGPVADASPGMAVGGLPETPRLDPDACPARRTLTLPTPAVNRGSPLPRSETPTPPASTAGGFSFALALRVPAFATHCLRGPATPYVGLAHCG